MQMLAAIFVALFVINAARNPLWAVFAYPTIGLLAWVMVCLHKGFTISSLRIVLLWPFLALR